MNLYTIKFHSVVEIDTERLCELYDSLVRRMNDLHPEEYEVWEEIREILLNRGALE